MAPKTAPTPLFATIDSAAALEVAAGAPEDVPAGAVTDLDGVGVAPAGVDVAWEVGVTVAEPLLAKLKGTVLTPVALPVAEIPAAVH